MPSREGAENFREARGEEAGAHLSVVGGRSWQFGARHVLAAPGSLH